MPDAFDQLMICAREALALGKQACEIAETSGHQLDRIRDLTNTVGYWENVPRRDIIAIIGEPPTPTTTYHYGTSYPRQPTNWYDPATHGSYLEPA